MKSVRAQEYGENVRFSRVRIPRCFLVAPRPADCRSATHVHVRAVAGYPRQVCIGGVHIVEPDDMGMVSFGNVMVMSRERSSWFTHMSTSTVSSGSIASTLSGHSIRHTEPESEIVFNTYVKGLFKGFQTVEVEMVYRFAVSVAIVFIYYGKDGELAISSGHP